MSEELPKFESFEEIEEWLKKDPNKISLENTPGTSKGSKTPTTGSGSTKTGSSRKKKQPAKKKKVSVAPDEAAPVGKPDAGVWSVVHFYTQPGDTINKTRVDAKEESKFRGDNVRTFYHDHLWGEKCSYLCGGVE